MRHAIRRLRPAAPILALCLTLAPAHAQDDGDDGFNLMEEGAKLFFRGIMQEMEPALKDLEGMARALEPQLRQFAREMGPALSELMDEVEDWTDYHPPVMLPNGDIIMRKKTVDDMIEDGDEIEL